MKDFLIWVVASIGSLFGMYSQPVTSPISAPVQVVQTQTSTSPQDDQSLIVSTVQNMLTAYRNVTTFQDAENTVSQYATQAMVNQLQTAISTMPSASLSFLKTELVTVDHSYPDPTSLIFNTAINGNFATTTAILPTTTSTSTQNFNGKPNSEIITSTFQNNLTVDLQKENGQWKVSKIIVSSKGIGNKYSPNNK